MAMREDAIEVSLELAGEGFERIDAAVHGTPVPLFPEASGIPDVPVVPQFLQLVFQEICGQEPAIGASSPACFTARAINTAFSSINRSSSVSLSQSIVSPWLSNHYAKQATIAR